MEALVIMEVSKKQHYIFKSNRLKDNVGASAIMRYVTESIFESAKYPELNLKKYRGELVTKGGGNSIFHFHNVEEAKKFITSFSKIILEVFQGLELFMTYIEFDMENGNSQKAVDDLYTKLNKKKSERKNSFGQIDFGVTKGCKRSRFPSTHLDSKGNPVSQEIYRKDKFDSKDSFKELLPDDCKYLDPDKFDEQNNSELKNMIAIVHIDGNNMGKEVMKIKNEYRNSESGKAREYFKKLQKFSEAIDKSYKDAFKKSLIELKQEIKREMIKSGKEMEGIITLPIRPLILAGDDVCFIVTAAYGIEISRIFLEKLKENTEGNFHACAGVSIVKSKYPFFKAYKLSEELCSNAKKSLLNAGIENGSAIDWHISFGELDKSLSEIRERDYLTEEDKNDILFRRPYLVFSEKPNNLIPSYNYSIKKDEGNISADNFIGIYTLIEQISKNDKEKAKDTSRGQIKAYRNVIKKGRKATEEYLRIHNKAKDHLPEEEFIENKSRCFDAIEIMDVFKRIGGDK